MYRLSLWLRGHPWVADVVVVLVLSIPPIGWQLPGFRPAWVQVIVHGWLVLPLLWRRRYPSAVAAIVLAGAWTQLLGRVWGLNLTEADLALVVVLYTLVIQGRRRQALLFASCVGLGIAVWAASWELGPDPRPINAVAVAFFGIVPTFAAAWTFGEFRRARTELAESERQALARAAVADERTRIARELHDVLAHTVSVMVVNAEGARLARHTDPEAVDRTLETISTTGRAALGELRRLLGVLDGEQAPEPAPRSPQPTVADLRRVVARAGEGRPPITLHVDGVRDDLPASAAVQTYRIVQEALTNVIKHAPVDATAEVSVHFGPRVVRIEVVNSGGFDHSGSARPAPPGNPAQSPPRPAPLPSSGRGLTGIRERVAMFGGTLDAGPTPDGGYRLAATLTMNPVPA